MPYRSFEKYESSRLVTRRSATRATANLTTGRPICACRASMLANSDMVSNSHENDGSERKRCDMSLAHASRNSTTVSASPLMTHRMHRPSIKK